MGLGIGMVVDRGTRLRAAVRRKLVPKQTRRVVAYGKENNRGG